MKDARSLRITESELQQRLGEDDVRVIDARPPADYTAGHITGAVSVPFYRVDDAVPFLPEDAWLIAYCGCPHALSGDVAEQLAELGFDRVAVLDEGWFDWVAGGHPTTEGPSQY